MVYLKRKGTVEFLPIVIGNYEECPQYVVVKSWSDKIRLNKGDTIKVGRRRIINVV